MSLYINELHKYSAFIPSNMFFVNQPVKTKHKPKQKNISLLVDDFSLILLNS